jgi:hypothetical protein
VVAEHFGRESDPVEMVLPFAVGLVVCASCTVIPLVLARRKLERLERA